MEWVKEVGGLGLGGVALVGVIWLMYNQQKAAKPELKPEHASDEPTVKALEKVADAVNRLNTFLEVQAAKDELLMKELRRLLESIVEKLDELRAEQLRHVRDCQDCHRAHQGRGADD